MFAYGDPVGTDLLASVGALAGYRGLVDVQYQGSGSLRNSGFATLEAFSQLTPGIAADRAQVGWNAYPVSQSDSTEAQIDAQRFALQDEYVEWLVERENGAVARVTFTTEFAEYYLALAAAGKDALVAGIRAVYPDADPTPADLGGLTDPGVLGSPDVFRLFLQQLRLNPWNSGQKGILCLAHRSNTMGALFGLVDQCAVPRPAVPVGSVCGGDFCVRERDSDPRVCAAAQGIVRSGSALTLADPVGVVIGRLGGNWAVDGSALPDVNAEQGVWNVSRNGRRATLTVTPGLTLGGAPVASGAQVARLLGVSAAVLTAPDAALPVWARTGNEQTRG